MRGILCIMLRLNFIFLLVDMQFSNPIYWRVCPFPHCVFLAPYQRSVNHICMGLFLGSLFCSIGLYVCLYASTMLFFKKYFIYLFLERGEGREEKERSINEREKYWWIASHMHPYQGLNMQPRYVPWPGIEPATFALQYDNQPTEPHAGQH